jgi:hypothetical protein
MQHGMALAQESHMQLSTLCNAAARWKPSHLAHLPCTESHSPSLPYVSQPSSFTVFTSCLLPQIGHVTFFWNGNRSGYINANQEEFVEVGDSLSNISRLCVVTANAIIQY